MQTFERYAIFFTPPAGPFADAGAAWLGWDSAAGANVTQPAIKGFDVAAITTSPRKYGFHGTLKAPFRLAPGVDEAALTASVQACASQFAPAVIDGLSLRHENGFLAMRPMGDTADLRHLAAHVVRELDHNRARLSDTDVARRRAAGLTNRQDEQMLSWGYPYIFEDFHFHMTLSGEIDANLAQIALPVLQSNVAVFAPCPCVIDAITLMGQDSAGMFHQLHRCALLG